jgi:hypothetical protein
MTPFIFGGSVEGSEKVLIIGISNVEEKRNPHCIVLLKVCQLETNNYRAERGILGDQITKEDEGSAGIYKHFN